MSESKEENLLKSKEEFLKEFPELFSNKHSSAGFYLPKGWSRVVWNLCSLIEWHLKYHKEPKPKPQVVQVKEKFGGLRFYINGGDETINAFITFAESMCSGICQSCGTNQGVERKTDRYWMNTRCGSCRETEEVQRVKRDSEMNERITKRKETS
jgi:hypothetical protein